MTLSECIMVVAAPKGDVFFGFGIMRRIFVPFHFSFENRKKIFCPFSVARHILLLILVLVGVYVFLFRKRRKVFFACLAVFERNMSAVGILKTPGIFSFGSLEKIQNKTGAISLAKNGLSNDRSKPFGIGEPI